jgi:predicted dehydrogenase
MVDDGRDTIGSGIETIAIDTCDQYTIQGDLFSRAVLDNTPVAYPLEMTLQNMRIIEAVFRSAETGQWVSL